MPGILAKLYRDVAGSVGTLFALSLVPISLATLGAVDTANVLRTRVELQDALDAAALAAAKSQAGDDRGVAAAGREIFGHELRLDGVRDLHVDFRLTQDGKVVEAEASRAVDLYFFDRLGGRPVSVRAKSKVLRSGPQECVIAFNPTQSKALWLSGSFEVVLDECSAHVNSKSPSAFEMGGSSRMEAVSVEVVGGTGAIGGALNAKLNTGAAAARDPLASMAVPTGGACDHTGLSVGENRRFAASGRPMVFCGGLQINGGAVTFDPGVYVIRGGQFTVNGNTVTRGKDVTFVLTGGATIHIAGGANIKLSAPGYGATAGVLIMQERKSSGSENIFNGGATQDLEGALYFPNQTVRFNGNNRTASACLALYADVIEWTGDAALGLKKCTGAGSSVRIIE